MSSRTRSEFGTIAERTSGVPVADAGTPATGTHAPAPDAEAAPREPAVRFVTPRHVWVDGDQAGLLLAWRRLGSWQGRVFWCPPDTPEAALDWIDQQRLQPRDPR